MNIKLYDMKLYDSNASEKIQIMTYIHITIKVEFAELPGGWSAKRKQVQARTRQNNRVGDLLAFAEEPQAHRQTQARLVI